MPAGDVGKCLGYYCGKGSFTNMVNRREHQEGEAGLLSLRKDWCFSGGPQPSLSSRSVLKTCVMPILLSGCEI